jgi:hypothetical protein
MAERKAVLNDTVAETVAAAARAEAAAQHATVSSVVERALAAHLDALQRRAQGIAAIDDYYRDFGFPSESAVAEGEALAAEDQRLIEEARRVGLPAESDGKASSAA